MKKIIALLTVLTLTVSLAAQGDNAEGTAEDSDKTAAMIERAEAELARGENDVANEPLNATIAADPESSLAHTRLGGALMLKQDYSGSIEQFQQAINLDNESAPAFIGLGMAYLHLKQPGPAKPAFRGQTASPGQAGRHRPPAATHREHRSGTASSLSREALTATPAPAGPCSELFPAPRPQRAFRRCGRSVYCPRDH